MLPILENIHTILIAIGAVVTGVILIKSKIGEILLTKLQHFKSKASLKNETIQTTDVSINSLVNRVNKLTIDFTKLSEENIIDKKQNYEYQNLINQLEFDTQKKVKEIDELKAALDNLESIIKEKCKNKCIDV